MKSNRKENKRIHESWIGKIIYGFLMFIPLLAIGITCLYVVFNKNAYQSYGEKYETKSLTITTTELSNTYYLQGQTITWYLNDNSYGSRSGKYGFSDISLDLNNLLNTQDVIFNSYEFYTSNADWMYFYDTNDTQYQISNYKEKFTTFTYTIDLSTYSRKITNTNYGNYVITIYQPAPLSNVFYYSIEKISNNNLFNWTQNSIIYTGMSATTQSLNIETPFIPMLLTYWLIISVLYFLYDIILIIFHVLHRKIHELEESI